MALLLHECTRWYCCCPLAPCIGLMWLNICCMPGTEDKHCNLDCCVAASQRLYNPGRLASSSAAALCRGKHVTGGRCRCMCNHDAADILKLEDISAKQKRPHKGSIVEKLQSLLHNKHHAPNMQFGQIGRQKQSILASHTGSGGPGTDIVQSTGKTPEDVRVPVHQPAPACRWQNFGL